MDFPGFSMIVKPASEKDQFSYITLRDGLTDFLRLVGTKGPSGSNSHKKIGAIVLLDEADGLTKNENLLRILSLRLLKEDWDCHSFWSKHY